MSTRINIGDDMASEPETASQAVAAAQQIDWSDSSDSDGSVVSDEPQAKRATPISNCRAPPAPIVTPTRSLKRKHSPRADTVKPPSFQSIQHERYYRRLLDRAIKAAQSIQFPSQGSYSIFGDFEKGQRRYRFMVLDNNDKSRRQKVGGAGELFVFELLSRICPALPEFDRECWVSKARDHVRAHPKYSRWGPCGKEATFDINYKDTTGNLTAVFIDKGYLDPLWRDKEPHYFIDVKTTMSSDPEWPFYLTKNQYSHYMSSGAPKNQVYALFRVFGLESGRIGFKVYMDLEAAKESGDLEFEVNEWRVTPTKKLSAVAPQEELGILGQLDPRTPKKMRYMQPIESENNGHGTIRLPLTPPSVRPLPSPLTGTNPIRSIDPATPKRKGYPTSPRTPRQRMNQPFPTPFTSRSSHSNLLPAEPPTPSRNSTTKAEHTSSMRKTGPP